MAESPTQDGGASPAQYEPLDRGRVDLLNPVEVQYWCDTLACDEDELRDAVARAGDHTAAVREHLASRT